uniref:Pentatricopeptide repeat-containing protein n=1 Tax=Ananas comosus var. bracteatus TaxID=296719 RepID=A0A6V7NHH5_ANACO|nr:unnamed protein product [Ananas comosus var. bracteatus]
MVSKLPNDKEVIYGALDRWIAWETEFPVIAATKALEILRRRNQWLRIIQVTKWLLSKGQVLTLETYDTLLLAFNMEGRIDEAESIGNTYEKGRINITGSNRRITKIIEESKNLTIS